MGGGARGEVRCWACCVAGCRGSTAVDGCVCVALAPPPLPPCLSPRPSPSAVLQAEAQCAWLEANGLVDGVVTDDNDVFLFGARHVYRHIFESKK